MEQQNQTFTKKLRSGVSSLPLKAGFPLATFFALSAIFPLLASSIASNNVSKIYADQEKNRKLA